MRTAPLRVPVAVIGAGPYGLSVAAHLRGRGIEARVFGEPMGVWRNHMPAGMFLKSVAGASSLSAPEPGFTLADFFAKTGSAAPDEQEPVPIELFVRYGLWFHEQVVPAVERVHVRRITSGPDGFDVLLESGEELRAQAAVLASGHLDYAHIPRELARLAPDGPSPAGPVSHSAQHRNFSSLSGREVAVLGGGQSALESAALLHEAGARPHVLVRGSQLLWADPPDQGAEGWARRLLKPPSALGPGWSLYTVSRAPAFVRRLPARSRLILVRKVLGPSGAWWLRERVVGRVDLHTGWRLERASLANGSVSLRGRTADLEEAELSVDHVIAATGYRVNLDANDFLDSDLLAGVKRLGGSPQLTASFESSVRGLFFTGLSAAATFGPLLRFVCGADFAAQRIAVALVERSGRGRTRA